MELKKENERLSKVQDEKMKQEILHARSMKTVRVLKLRLDAVEKVYDALRKKAREKGIEIVASYESYSASWYRLLARVMSQYQ
jgi:hypothetical protein